MKRAGTIGFLVVTCLFVWMVIIARAAETPKVQLNAASVEPREIEDTTGKAVVRDYSAAWQNLAEAMAENRRDVLAQSFVGFALDNFGKAIEDQKRTGITRRYIDRGHKVDAVFYSPEGSAMELRDTAQLEEQILDGGKVIHSETLTQHYVVLMTAAENSWKVRVMEAVGN